eukprot:6188457-Pleurochrysis_carterae.AAC.1
MWTIRGQGQRKGAGEAARAHASARSSASYRARARGNAIATATAREREVGEPRNGKVTGRASVKRQGKARSRWREQISGRNTATV